MATVASSTRREADRATGGDAVGAAVPGLPPSVDQARRGRRVSELFDERGIVIAW
jgi:hypothetical protein